MESSVSVVLVTGGSGFIGSHLVRRLSSAGHSVIALDDGYASNVDSIRGLANVEVILGSVAAPEDVDKCLGFSPTHVAHLAVRNITSCAQDVFGSIETNVVGTANLLMALCRSAPIERLVLASSTSVHSDGTMNEMFAIDPRTTYSKTKLAAELCCACAKYALPIIMLRLSNVYGPGQHDAINHSCGVIGKFMRAAITGSHVSVYGDGFDVRDYTYVSDVVEALCAAMFADSPSGSIFNIGTGVGTSTVDLLSALRFITGAQLPLVYEQQRQIDVVRERIVDASLFRARFGWTCRSLADGLTDTWEWWQCQTYL